MEIHLTKEDLVAAIKQIDDNPKLISGRHSSTYDLIYNKKKYPPILVLSLANEAKNKTKLTLEDFGNNVDIPFKILRENGFEIKAKSGQKKMNYKQQYKAWAENALQIEDSTKQQYVNAIENLSRIVKYDIFEVDDINRITDLYEDLLKNQKIIDGKYYEIERSSASLKGWYSASVKTYLNFLKSKEKGGNMSRTPATSKFNHQKFIQDIRKGGLYYSNQHVTRFTAALITKPFVILTGLSGSGKTKLAQAFVQWICIDESQYRIVPVGADWTNREPLLGYPNALNPKEYVKPENKVLDLMIAAQSNPELPFFLILDEMNLSHVERYFADFLSVMESNEEIPLHAEDKVENGVPSNIKLPSNLFIIGTVNIDETTNMFSPKVLDRANTIEFRINDLEMESFLNSMKELNMEALYHKGANMAQDFLKLSYNKSFATEDIDDITKTLLKFFGELKKTGAEFGYRTASEIMRLIHQLSVLGGEMSPSDKIDIAIMQKLLPKLHGSRRKLCPILETLGGFCVNNKENIVKNIFEKEDFDFSNEEEVLYPLSLEKISRMYNGAIDNGFTSFAEA